MYVPDHFRADDREMMHALMRTRPFATLVSATADEGLVATHLPTVLDTTATPDGSGIIEAHFARANAHWKALRTASDVLVIYQGAHAYVRPGWYPSKAEGGKAVPTWNYAAVHASGTAEIITDPEWLRRHVAALSRQQEQDRTLPWSIDDAPEAYVQMKLRGIVGVRVTITRLEGKWKMSQNRAASDQQGVVEGLSSEGVTTDEAEVAAVMSARLRSDLEPESGG